MRSRAPIVDRRTFLRRAGIFGAGIVLAHGIPRWAEAAVAFDAASHGFNAGAGFNTTLTVSHTVAGSNTILFARAGFGDNLHTDSLSSVTYNGDNLTKIDANSVGSFYRNELWYIINPDAGTHDIVFTATAGVNVYQGGGVSLTGVHQSSPLGTAVKATGTSDTATVDISVGAGEWGIDTVYFQNGPTLGSSNQTQREVEQDNVSGNTGGSATSASTGTVTMSWASNAGSVNWGIIAVPVKPASASSPIRRRVIRY